ncbi:MAG TPA: Rad52/Rad22 family DNA repair protein [Ktedonobacterales bacterium]|jgi:hypothetical protein|nr:Rad52/Rad22 family DNA repair protein [Ktedonobacterales bacterium]
MSDTIDWRAFGAALAAPFAPEAVEWRIQGKGGAHQRAQLVAYISARDVAERLDEVVTPGGWSFDWTPLHLDAAGDVQTARGVLTIYGVSKSDVGTGSNFEASKGCVSDTLKRCAVLWGVGRYLYSLPQVWVTLDDKGRVPETMLAKLRESLRKRAAA